MQEEGNRGNLNWFLLQETTSPNLLEWKYLEWIIKVTDIKDRNYPSQHPKITSAIEYKPFSVQIIFGLIYIFIEMVHFKG